MQTLMESAGGPLGLAHYIECIGSGINDRCPRYAILGRNVMLAQAGIRVRNRYLTRRPTVGDAEKIGMPQG